MRTLLETVCLGDEPDTFEVAQRVFSAYDGKGSQWVLADFSSLWKVSFGNSAGVVGVLADDRRLCVKLFYDSRLKSRIRNFLRCSKAKKAYRKGLRLNAAGIPSPRMIAYAENRHGMGLIITDLADGFKQVDHWVEENGPEASVAEALGRFVRQMHEAGVTHKDLSLRNILIRNDGSEFLLLDYEDCRLFRTVSEKQRLDNLHHLNERTLATIPGAVRRAFLAAYLNDEKQVECWCEKLSEMIRKCPSKYTKSSKSLFVEVL